MYVIAEICRPTLTSIRCKYATYGIWPSARVSRSAGCSVDVYIFGVLRYQSSVSSVTVGVVGYQ